MCKHCYSIECKRSFLRNGSIASHRIEMSVVFCVCGVIVIYGSISIAREISFARISPPCAIVRRARREPAASERARFHPCDGRQEKCVCVCVCGGFSSKTHYRRDSSNMDRVCCRCKAHFETCSSSTGNTLCFGPGKVVISFMTKLCGIENFMTIIMSYPNYRMDTNGQS